MVDAKREPRVILRRFGRRVVVEEHEVEIGGVAELFAAQLAITDDRERGRFAMALAHVPPREPQHLAQDRGREIAQMIGERFERQRAREVLREETHGLGMLEVPQHVHLFLGVVARFVQLTAQRRSQSRPVRRLEQRARVEQLIEQNRDVASGIAPPTGSRS